MALSDGRVQIPEHSGDRATDDIAPTEYDDIGACNWNAGGPEEMQRASWRARRV
jgi:hypothetical protein